MGEELNNLTLEKYGIYLDIFMAPISIDRACFFTGVHLSAHLTVCPKVNLKLKT